MILNRRGCTDDQSISSETISTVAPPAVTTTPPVEIMSQQLCRVGSGASSSVVVDHHTDAGSGVLEAQSRKLPSSRFKGVVPQPNGRWGAQIYEKHQRVWLGTFNEEHEAAKVYDIAVQRFRGRDAVTNFKPRIAGNISKETAAMEASFLSSHSKSEIVDMLRKHTYNDELEQSKRIISCSSSLHNNTTSRTGLLNQKSSRSGSHKPREHLFQKTVTPSDVGKLNRLVIPKQHAEKHFPVQKGIISTNSKGVLLHFEDKDSKVWRFRYSYWNSSQSYVLTKGWSRFVKEKNLKAGDSVTFESSTGPANKQLYIDWKSKTTQHPAFQPAAPVKLERPVQMLRLFGVNISSVSSCNGKRSSSNTEMDLLGFQNCKKQRIINVL